jgi:hypothetical protein
MRERRLVEHAVANECLTKQGQPAFGAVPATETPAVPAPTGA